MKSSHVWTPQAVAARIDHACLAPEATRRDIEKLCAEAKQYGFFAVCVNGTWVAFCRKLLKGTSIRIVAVVGFPLGACTTSTKVFEARQALQDGADEIDMVMSVGDHNGNDDGQVRRDIAEVARLVHDRGKILKVIIETALLQDDASKRRACQNALEAGADFIKTCTGRNGGHATKHDVTLMAEETKRHATTADGSVAGVKASGGVQTWDTACMLLNAGADRIGASASVAILEGAPAAKK